MSPGIPRANAREMVAFSGYAPGTIVGKTDQRRLNYVVDDRRALRFPVDVGRAGVKTRTEVIAGGAANNPMGAAALTMRGGEYAIHGTNRPASIGGFVS